MRARSLARGFGFDPTATELFSRALDTEVAESWRMNLSFLTNLCTGNPTMTPAEMLRIVDTLYTENSKGNFDLTETLLADDFFVTEADSLPYAGVFRGKRALRDLFTKVFSMMDVAGLDRIQATAGGDYVVEILRMRFADPSLAPAELAELFRFRDGKVCEIKPFYFDPGPVIAACAAKKKAGTK
jgi:ketosteroid isomerase-like protein